MREESKPCFGFHGTASKITAPAIRVRGRRLPKGRDSARRGRATAITRDYAPPGHGESMTYEGRGCLAVHRLRFLARRLDARDPPLYHATGEAVHAEAAGGLAAAVEARDDVAPEVDDLAPGVDS